MSEVEDFNIGLANTTKPINGSSLYIQLQNLGCCKFCTLRFLGETSSGPYSNVHEALKNRGYNDVENGPKIAKCNPCSACLGLLQSPTSYDTVDKVVDALQKADYDSDTFNVALTLPIAFYLRAHAFWLFLSSNFQSHCQLNLPIGCVTIGVKDAWKYVIVPKIEERIGKKFDVNSDLIISIGISYNDDYKESLCLLEMHPQVYGKQQAKGRNKEKKVVFSRKSVENILKQTDDDHFKKYYTIPPSVPTLSAVCEEVTPQHNSIFIAGRYNKYSRTLPQTPWIINGKRRMDSSVQEIIAEPIQTLARAEGNKFLASGREDVDVRMIGKGRPFAVELLDPHKTKYSFEDFRQLEKIINSADGRKVAVRDLQHVSKESLVMLKEGEEKKTKEYHVYCIAWGVDANKLQSLSSMAPLTLLQRTPVRVLHRRPVATRQKCIHWITTTLDKVCGDTTYFKMTLNTQAGTYIKEFVHGDFGRTTPSIGELLGNATADVLALDVQEIILNWPPEVDYSTL